MGALERYRLLLATVLPRPIAWVTTRDAAGAINAAPFSFFNVFGSDPATVGIGIGSRGPAEPKDTRANIRANEQFVVNLVPFALAGADARHVDCLSQGHRRAKRSRPVAGALDAGRRSPYRRSAGLDGVHLHAGNRARQLRSGARQDPDGACQG